MKNPYSRKVGVQSTINNTLNHLIMETNEMILNLVKDLIERSSVESVVMRGFLQSENLRMNKLLPRIGSTLIPHTLLRFQTFNSRYELSQNIRTNVRKI